MIWVVEAEPALPENYRSPGFQPDREGGQQHHRPEHRQRCDCEDDIEPALQNTVPRGNRLVEDRQQRRGADMGVRAFTESELVGMRRKPDVHGKDPEPFQELQYPALGGKRDRDDQHVDASAASELDQFLDRAELRIACDHWR